MNRITFIGISLMLAASMVGLLIVVSRDDQNSQGVSLENIVVRDNVQYITITAQGGYTPRVTNAQANIPTKLIVKTDNTYDCSSALVIRSIKYQKMLSPTGEEIIDLGTPGPGVIKGTCSMGMYGFTINFK